jgi:hypothetical protein
MLVRVCCPAGADPGSWAGVGWWWYGLTQENVRSPTALAANYLLAGNPAPAGAESLEYVAT